MAATASIIGKGSKLGYKAVGGSGSYTNLAEVTDCSLPELTIGNIDATHMESPDNYVEKLSAEWRDVSDVSFTLNFVASGTAAIYGIAGNKQDWQILLKDGSSWKFTGFLSKLGGGTVNPKDIVKMPGAITVTGPVVFAAGA